MTDLDSKDRFVDAEVVLERDPRAPARARSFLASQIPRLDRLGDAALALSELVTNAVEHVDSGRVQVRLEATDAVVRIEVISRAGPSSVEMPPPEPAPSHLMRGRGLAIVGEVADRMGVESGDETRVWFEMDR